MSTSKEKMNPIAPDSLKGRAPGVEPGSGFIGAIRKPRIAAQIDRGCRAGLTASRTSGQPPILPPLRFPPLQQNRLPHSPPLAVAFAIPDPAIPSRPASSSFTNSRR